MGLFNRYETHNQGLEYSFEEFNDNYCNPEDYMVTKEESKIYLNELITANERNKELNEIRRKRWMTVTYIGVAVVGVTIVALISLWLYNDNSTWVAVLCYIILIGTLAISVWLINTTERYFHETTIYWGTLYPKVNQNIEKLFDDFLWKQKKIRETCTRKAIEKTLINQRAEEVRNMVMDCSNNCVKYTSVDMYKCPIDYDDLIDAKMASFDVGDLLEG